MDKTARLACIVGFVALVTMGCGTDENVISQDGPIANPAIDAGLTQAQGAPGPDGPTFETEDLRIELDGETIEIDDLADLEELDEFSLSEAAALTNCVALLNNAPSLSIDRCSYDPSASEVIVDQLNPGECNDGKGYVTLNRLDGSGAYVGVLGESWFEVPEADLNFATIDLICAGSTG